MKNITRMTMTLGLAAVLGGLVSLVPAQAQDSHIRHDVADIQHDQRRIDDLYNQRRRQEDRHYWRGIERTDRAIDDLQRHIDRDRHDVRIDVHRVNEDRYRSDSYRRDQDRNRYRDDSYRQNQDRNRSYDDNGDSHYRHSER